ncbi:hypothetical protein GGX14DRAFT_566524 [Mycena pura]|uniref:Uncharacterized protein n=1 Tax=Mycena pura TaxID=153505 RepID=A0AAD6VJH6_9AGAR|nr:hypothetical protein GGX14DRAFT_566524 [Mycena pura]
MPAADLNDLARLTSPTPPIHSAAHCSIARRRSFRRRRPTASAAPPLSHRRVATRRCFPQRCPVAMPLVPWPRRRRRDLPVVYCCCCPHPCRRLSTRCRTRDQSAALGRTYGRILIHAMPVGELEEKHGLAAGKACTAGDGVAGSRGTRALITRMATNEHPRRCNSDGPTPATLTARPCSARSTPGLIHDACNGASRATCPSRLLHSVDPQHTPTSDAARLLPASRVARHSRSPPADTSRKT